MICPTDTIFVIVCLMIVLFAIIGAIYLWNHLHTPPQSVSDVPDEITLDDLFSDVEPDEESPAEDTETPDLLDLFNENIEIGHPSGPQRTEYMEYLERNQLEGFKVYRVRERSVHASNSSIDLHPAYLFTVFHSDGLYLLIFESTWSQRNTLLFTVQEDKVENATRAILRYFASDRPNKRRGLSQYMKYLKRSGVVKCMPRMHNNFESWKNSVRFSPRRMVRDVAANK